MDSILRPVLQAIIEQCMNKGVQVSNALAAIVLRATILKNADGMQMEAALKKSDVKSLVQMCVDRLAEKNSPSLETIKQQVGFESKLISEHERLEELVHQHAYMTKNLLSEIATLNARGYAAMEVLYRKAVSYMIASSKLGETTDVTAVKETTAVLETVFPRDELQAFLACPRQEREFQMEELSVIVAGIRLLNRELGKGGECIDDAPGLAIAQSTELEKRLHTEMTAQRVQIEKYTSAASHLHYKVDSDREYQIEQGRITRLQDEANNHQQFLSHATILLEDVADLKDRLMELRGLYHESILGLKNATSDPTKAPTPEKIFPMFMTLAKIWQQIEKERAQLGARDNLYQTMVGMKGNFTPTLTDDDISESLNTPSLSRVSATKFAELEAVKSLSGAVVIDSRNVANTSILEFKGFCPWTIVKRDGLLLKGDAANAIVRYQGKYYACASDQAITEFTANPSHYIEGVISLAKVKPELIFLLELQSVFPSMQTISAGIMRKGKLIRSQNNNQTTTTENVPLKRDADTQTEAHPLPSYIDRNYCWNEWELRRNAIKLVELRYKATHSTQTKNSHFRRDNYSQHYAPKESTTQTGISTGTSPVIKKNFMTGVRGKPSQSAKVVKLELEL